MRFDLFQQIIRRIHQDIHCPKCEKRLNESALEVFGLNSEVVELATVCSGCQSVVDILAHIELRMPSQLKPLHMRALSRKQISSDAVQKISDRIRNFQGKDIQELFQS